MRRLPLSDELKIRFRTPTVSPLWVKAGGAYYARLLRREQWIDGIEIDGAERIAGLVKSGDGVLICPNHPDDADAGVVFELGRRSGHPFYFMAAYQIFRGMAGFVLPRVGCFPVDREGADLRAFKLAVEVLGTKGHPLVVFPEGEIYRMADRLTPLREGAAAIALAGTKKRANAGKAAWIVPVGLKYRFGESTAPEPELHRRLTELERRFNWWPSEGQSLVERIYRYALGAIQLKELEYLGSAREGPLPERLAAIRCAILDRLEDALLARRSTEHPPVRVKELRRACLERLAKPEATEADRDAVRKNLFDLDNVIGLFSYPGDYVRSDPTLERAAEIVTKLEQDFLDRAYTVPPARRKAFVAVGEPIDCREFLVAGRKARLAAPDLTHRLEERMQALLDSMPKGRAIREQARIADEPLAVSGERA